MQLSQTLSVLLMAGSASAAAVNLQSLRTCFFPEPAEQVCYSVPGATPQDLDLREVNFVAQYLRAYEAQVISQGGEPFWKMPLPAADHCAEWQVASRGRTWVMAKLVGNEQAGVLFSDIANTIDGEGLEDPSRALLNCGTAGGQMGAIVDKNNIYYRTQMFEGFTNEGIVIKLVKSPM